MRARHMRRAGQVGDGPRHLRFDEAEATFGQGCYAALPRPRRSGGKIG